MKYEKVGLLVEIEIRRIIVKFVSSGGWRSFLITVLNHGILLQDSRLIDLKVGVHSQTARYLGMTLDAKLRWKVHVKKKWEELGLKYRQMYWLLGRRLALTTYNKLVLYKQILKPVWTYGIQL